MVTVPSSLRLTRRPSCRAARGGRLHVDHADAQHVGHDRQLGVVVGHGQCLDRITREARSERKSIVPRCRWRPGGRKAVPSWALGGLDAAESDRPTGPGRAPRRVGRDPVLDLPRPPPPRAMRGTGRPPPRARASSTRARIDHLLDPGSFRELGTLGGDDVPADAIVRARADRRPPGDGGGRGLHREGRHDQPGRQLQALPGGRAGAPGPRAAGHAARGAGYRAGTARATP